MRSIYAYDMHKQKQTDADIIPPFPNREENLAEGIDEMVPDPDDMSGGINFGGSQRPDLEQADTEDVETTSPQQDNENKNIPHIPSSEDTIALKSPTTQGDESVSGSTPDPTSDDDMLEDAHAVGEQEKENLEHPQEVDIGKNINQAEDDIHES